MTPRWSLTAAITFCLALLIFAYYIVQTDYKMIKNFQTSLKARLSPTVKTSSSLQDAINQRNKSLKFIQSLKTMERREYSQNKEDGVIEALFKEIGAKSKYFVEFGVENGVQCNTRYLREKKDWVGLLMDGSNSIPSINLQKEMMYPDNIVQLFKKYNVPYIFDLLSEDTDFKDFWLIKAILTAGYRPRIIISEINTFLGGTASKTIPLNWNETRWDNNSKYFGYSVKAGWHLARKFNYSLIYCESVGVNCFYVINGVEGFGEGFRLSDYISSESVWVDPITLPHRNDIKNRPYVDIGPEL